MNNFYNLQIKLKIRDFKNLAEKTDNINKQTK